jgi:purine-binding chemotaxis protein CheW
MSNQTALAETIQVVTFTITEKSTKKGNYAVPIDQVKEIRTVDTITKIPKSKSYVKGVMNLRGKIIPIIDVNDKIGLSASREVDITKQRILVADVNDTLTGLLVDEVNEVMRLPSKDIESPPIGAFEHNNYIKGIAKRDDQLIVLLDVSKFLQESRSDIAMAMATDPEDSEGVPASPSRVDEGVLPEIEELIKQESQKQ